MMNRPNRAGRRASGSSASSLRVPSAPAIRRGLRFPIPWLPLAIVAGVAGVAMVMLYLVWQTGQPAGEPNAKWQAIEMDPAPDLPGEWVDLPAAYGAPYGAEGSNTADHVEGPVDFSKQGLPPAGGPMWGEESKAGIYREPQQPEALNHFMEGAGVVIWYNTSHIRDDLEDFTRGNKDKNILLTPFSDMEDETVAITVWGRRDKFPAGEYSSERLDTFIDKLYCRFDPEGMC